ncbi:leucyl aminopeptidase, peptidase M17 family [Campylobacter blaseri]|uniref:Probable cytosol aminopeptidase n=1 Tax=Campylobacter blaseri TaxID=2042961 RepID=A0A2P8QZY2_9BACT|nr:leucyl aminopeptidase [Campylobacter blaseri]PSM51806.1 leucyl aminopeptidase [Campylobacter blaseri]PSM53597.1 leucyl aminopeptidase [Campylobacter blaseri]QKF86409.1 leucyl aminopeptidase, peptidase M17 family [Campylobacter blaseri]
MKIELLDANINKIKADFEAILIVGKKIDHKFVKDSDKFKELNYDGGSNLLLLESKRLYIGVKELGYDQIRLAMSQIYNTLKNYNVKTIKISSYVYKCTTKTYQAVVEGFVLGSYEFNKYKSEAKKSKIEKIFISTDEYSGKKVKIEKAKLALKSGKIIAKATNFAKDGVNEIPEIYTPLKMAKEALKLAKKHSNIECKVYDKKFLKKERMNAFLMVNRASVHDPYMIHLKYTPKNKSKKRVVFVGKGLTYDSGGLSLKPASSMLTMKCDKSGALAAMAIIKAAAELKLPFEIHAVLGATENMIGGDAYKPDDVIITRSGISVEVRNTDAEGRLVLADCLDWAQELKPDILIDMATLTGACVVGLGEFTIGLLGRNEEFKAEYKRVASDSGELMNSLEFNDHLRECIKSKIADISNTATTRYGGTTTAGLFLEQFIKEENRDNWIHMDIAGPAYIERAWGYNQYGASGAGVRANLYYLQSLAREEK